MRPSHVRREWVQWPTGLGEWRAVVVFPNGYKRTIELLNDNGDRFANKKPSSEQRSRLKTMLAKLRRSELEWWFGKEPYEWMRLPAYTRRSR